MDQLAEIMARLGRIEGKVDSEVDSSKSQRKTIFEKLDKAVDTMAAAGEKIAVLANRVEQHVSADDVRFAKIEGGLKDVAGKVGSMELTGAKKAGLVALLSAGGVFVGAVGGVLVKMFGGSQ